MTDSIPRPPTPDQPPVPVPSEPGPITPPPDPQATVPIPEPRPVPTPPNPGDPRPEPAPAPDTRTPKVVAGAGEATMTDPVTDQMPDADVVAGEPAHTATDETTLTAVLASYAAAGFDAQLAVTDDGSVHCYTCGTDTAPGQVILHSLRRLEGASDPDDMLAVAAVTCSSCGAKGVLVLNYGPEATPGEAAVLLGLEDRRADDVLPGAQAPDEVVED